MPSLLFFSPSPVLTTIEGIIDRAVAGLEQDQPVRRVRCCERGSSSGTPERQTLVLFILRLLASHAADGKSVTGSVVCAVVSVVFSSGLPLAPVSQTRPLLQATDEEVARKIDEFIGKLKQLKEVHSSFTFVSARERAAPFLRGGSAGWLPKASFSR